MARAEWPLNFHKGTNHLFYLCKPINCDCETIRESNKTQAFPVFRLSEQRCLVISWDRSAQVGYTNVSLSATRESRPQSHHKHTTKLSISSLTWPAISASCVLNRFSHLFCCCGRANVILVSCSWLRLSSFIIIDDFIMSTIPVSLFITQRKSP